jgi:thioredoxin-related protein
MKHKVEDVEKETGVVVEHLDADKETEKVEQYNINELPAFIFVDDDGNELYRAHGIIPKLKLIELINKYATNK